ncbi:11123_t:CDS:2 [Scutellospora calospora]|uniref:11123_t:CDS:1 n=1 Tax=Scutellospora calospora TaxID=85575 RepID=A0ACA9JUB8_9GLOM|nr:11123_t:CDS:2 [Scutellospora calospora]
MYIDEHPKNSSTKEQQDTSRTNKSNNTQASVSERTKNLTLTTKDINMEKDSKTQKISSTNTNTSDKETAQKGTSSMY